MAQKFDATGDMAKAAPLAVLEGNETFLSAQHSAPASPSPVMSASFSMGLK